MTRLVYVDAIAGVAGDMLMGALLDAGAAEAPVREGLRKLDVELDLSTTTRHGIAARRVSIKGGKDALEREPVRRTWADVREILEGVEMPARAKHRADQVFRSLAEAEGRVHGIPADEVHFHEVGAIDAIADICGVALALEDLDVDAVVCSPLPCPRGFLDTTHGRLPLPAPAALELLRELPVHGVDVDVELVTPTGAAIVSAVGNEYGPLPSLRLEAIGYGAGTRDLEALPNVTRVFVGESVGKESVGDQQPSMGTVLLVEANLDDLSPELVPDAVARCFTAGALDVWVTAAQMKKGRPGVVLSALTRPGEERSVVESMLRETTTLGVRVASLRRWELERHWHTVEVEGEKVRVKLGALDGSIVNVAPEHDDCLIAARRAGLPVKAIWAAAAAQAERILGGRS